MGASLVKSCFAGDSSADLAAHREARRRYERQSQLLALEARDSRRGNLTLLSAASFGSDRSLADLPTPRQHLHQPLSHLTPIPGPPPAKTLKKKRSQAERALELPRTAVRLQQLRAEAATSARHPEDELSPGPRTCGREQDDAAPRKIRLSAAALARHALAASLSPSEAGTMSTSESSFGDDSAHLYASPPHFQSPPAADTRARSPATSFRAILPQEYVLDCVVGKGTTSTCYRCTRQTDGRRFACKIIEKRRLASSSRKRAEIAMQLRREVEVLQRVDHPNIAKLEEAFENDSFLILIMELLEGGELFDAIVEKGRFSEPEAIHVARSVLSAMKHMHERGIVHRDLKPENMLLAVSRKRRAGGCAGGASPMTVKIIDFGFAKVLDRGATSSSFLGTGGYLAPEILLHQPYAAPVDMWSFGVLVYLLLCGRLPFAATTQLRPNQKVSSLYKLSFPRKYWYGVSPLAMDFLQRVLVLNPSTRLTPAEALSHPWLRL